MKARKTAEVAKAEPRTPLLPHGISMFPNGKRWVVRVGKKFSGKNAFKKFFSSKEKALAFIAELKKKTLGELQTAKELGVSTLDMAEIRVALARISPTPLREVVDFWLERRPSSKAPSVGVAVEKLLELKKTEGCGARHLKDMKETYSLHFDPIESECIGDFDRDRILKLLNSNDTRGNRPSPSERAKRRKYFNILFNDAVAQRWIKENPLAGIKAPRKVASKKVIFTPQQVARLLWTTQHLAPQMLACLAMKCFSGIRNEELFKLPWSSIGSSIIVEAAFSKTKRRRSITITPPLKAWLTVCRRGVDEELVFSARPERANRPAAWYAEMKTIAHAAGITPWPQNALRHLYGSYHLAWKKDEGLTSYEMGNSPSVVRSNYVDAVTEEACKEFWRLLPAYVESLCDNDPLPDDSPAGTL
jgi:site-specific recombinase XerD